ncbi:hypothetical protein WOLCODRAFT_159419 [Wolfiporia cocos MD-104 SS10]|uniref:Uncharacterized protein n=1 Tax=Wolfiporia cocos (strain MD-104) TaxID=742152 RepID=A0A2H3JSM6_WOLCO|nr:hypothetical protein WOLCODRAFT_159419 [Wolfiporia cocos MD-104 SS10]
MPVIAAHVKDIYIPGIRDVSDGQVEEALRIDGSFIALRHSIDALQAKIWDTQRRIMMLQQENDYNSMALGNCSLLTQQVAECRTERLQLERELDATVTRRGLNSKAD